MDINLISDVLNGAQIAALRRGGASIDLADIAFAIVEIQPAKDALTAAGIAIPHAVSGTSTRGDLRLEVRGGGEIRASTELRAAIASVPDGTSRGTALALLFDAALGSGKVSIPAPAARAVKQALLAADSG